MSNWRFATGTMPTTVPLALFSAKPKVFIFRQ